MSRGAFCGKHGYTSVAGPQMGSQLEACTLLSHAAAVLKHHIPNSKLKCEVSVHQLLRLIENAILGIFDSEDCCHAHVPLHAPLFRSRTAAESIDVIVDHPLALSPSVCVSSSSIAERWSRGELSSFPSGRSCDCDDSSPQPCITAPLDVRLNPRARPPQHPAAFGQLCEDESSAWGEQAVRFAGVIKHVQCMEGGLR